MNKQNIIILTVLFAIAAIGVVWWIATATRGQKDTGEIEEITLAPQPSEALALIWVAEHEGFFVNNGLKVNIAAPSSVHEVVSAVQAGTVDVGTMGEYAFVRSDFEKNNLLVFGAIDSADTIQLIARSDRGVLEIADLKGKTIGVESETGPEFFLGSFLAKNNLSEAGINIIDLKSADAQNAISENKVDAVMIGGSRAHEIKKSLGDKVVAWPGQSEQPYYVVLVSKSDFVTSHKAAIEKLLRSLLEAEAFISGDPARAQLIVAKRLGYPASRVNQIWLGHNFALTLSENMMTLMDDESRWVIQNDMTDTTAIPKYHDYTYAEALKKIKPDAVTLVPPPK